MPNSFFGGFLGGLCGGALLSRRRGPDVIVVKEVNTGNAQKDGESMKALPLLTMKRD